MGGAVALVAVPASGGVPPTRVVSFDDGLTETLVMLGRPPIATADRQDWSVWTVEPLLPDSVQNLGSAQELNTELLVSLKPDLILTTPYLDGLLSTLQRIATCERLAVYEPGGDTPVPRAEAVTRRLSALLGIPEQGETLIAATREQFAADKARLSQLQPGPLLLVNFLDDRHVRVYGAKSLWQDVLDRIGLTNAWTGATTYWGFATVGIEQLAAVRDATLVVFAPIPADTWPTLRRSSLWSNLPFVKAGRMVNLPAILMFGTLPAAGRFSRLLTARLTAGPADGRVL